jgi:Icc-related predicted phosphoesterase
MKIQVVSDLHNEFGVMSKNYEQMIDTPADVLVLAGDIGTHEGIIPLLKDIQEAKGCPVIFVPGNHEYYGTSRKELDKKFAGACSTKLQILLEREIMMDGIAFIGSTGWWDGSGGEHGVNVVARHGLNDFRMIKDLRENGDGVWWGQRARTYLEGRLYFHRANNPDQKRVVITHHFPHRRSIMPQFAGSALNVCFYNAWEDIINEYRPELWIHGHTHGGFDYTVKGNDGFPHEPDDGKGVTRIVCNPQGYPEKFAAPKDAIMEHYKGAELVATEPDFNIYAHTENPNYDPCKVVEI